MELPLFVGIPTPDGRAPAMTINALKDMEGEIGRKVFPMVAQGSSIVKNRNNIVMSIQELVPNYQSSVPMLWLDSDIFLEYGSIPQVAKMVKWFDNPHTRRRGYSANYNGVDGRSVLALPGGEHPLAKNLKHAQRLSYAGFGFLMIDMPLDYLFHSGPLGEDVYFFEEVEVELRYWEGIKLWHQKLMVM